MWIRKSTVNGQQSTANSVDGGLSSVDERYGITGTTGLTPFVVVVGSNNFLPVPVCLLTRSEILEFAVT